MTDQQDSAQPEPVGFGCFKADGSLIHDLVGSEQDAKFWKVCQEHDIFRIGPLYDTPPTTQPAAAPLDPWRPFGLILAAALDRGEDPAWLMDEKSPLRDELRRLLAAEPAAPAAQSAEILPLDRPVDWHMDGKAITYRDCIRNQCGELALSYAEEIQRAAIASQKGA